MSEPEASAVGGADRIYAEPAEALETARSVLEKADSVPGERADALWVLGRGAYYANQMADAVRYLTEAAEQCEEASTLAEILLTLAPALSKQGHPDEALAILENPALGTDDHHAGQLLNQRGIILTELGRLPEATTELERALELFRRAEDTSRECRTLVNLGAVASMMGKLDESEQWYEVARRRSVDTGQQVVAAGIGGNLGYVASRRGRFAEALDWYAKARADFERLGEFGLLAAVLEVDHARTLLDVGLAADAADAADRAVRSAVAGENQMLETQARLLSAEALSQLGERRAARDALDRSMELARRHGQRAWELRAVHLASGLDIGLIADDAPTVEEEVTQLLESGWNREAFEVVLRSARQLRAVEPASARFLLASAEEWTASLDIDPVDRALGHLLMADIDGDLERGFEALDEALDALSEQRALMGSVEMRATIAGRVRPVRDAALDMVVRMDHPADALLDLLERTRSVRTVDAGPVVDADDAQHLVRLRSARVDLTEAKLRGSELAEASQRVRRLEQEILRRRRRRPSAPSARAGPDVVEQARTIPPDTSYVTYVIHRGNVLGLHLGPGGSQARQLGPLKPLTPWIRAQRTALRRLADERRGAAGDEIERLHHASRQLDTALIEPLAVRTADRLVLTPAAALRDVVWNALPTLTDRSITLAPTLSHWLEAPGSLDIDHVVVLGGPGLEDEWSELEPLGGIWGAGADVARRTSCADAMQAFQSADLVHVAAHGSFRSDNPLFSSIQFEDGPLALLELSQLRPVPSVVVLASCDAAASASPSPVDEVAVSTAAELGTLGVRVVIAPSVAVNDRLAAELSQHIHRGLAAGGSVDDVMVQARSIMMSSADPRRHAVALAFHVFGNQQTRELLRIRSAS